MHKFFIASSLDCDILSRPESRKMKFVYLAVFFVYLVICRLWRTYPPGTKKAHGLQFDIPYAFILDYANCIDCFSQMHNINYQYPCPDGQKGIKTPLPLINLTILHSTYPCSIVLENPVYSCKFMVTLIVSASFSCSA